MKFKSARKVIVAGIVFMMHGVCTLSAESISVIRTNNIGYFPDDIKAAVYLGDRDSNDIDFIITDTKGNKITPDSVVKVNPWNPVPYAARIYFSSVATPGEYTIIARDRKGHDVTPAKSIYIGKDAYSRLDLQNLPLYYIRQQRCGYNPVHGDSCHTIDGYAVLAGENTGKYFDVTGGWHDASDYLQYLPTSANTVYQMLFAYQQTPEVFTDKFDKDGKPGSNGVADILDEARYGLEWMLKMNPSDSLYFNQIADDRDHRYAGVPSGDTVDYELPVRLARPVYPTSGQPYGLKKYKNRSRGEASSVAKFASAFALGADIFKESDSGFASLLAEKAEKAYQYARQRPGACQTAPCISPYFYEEDNYVDDLELAAAQLNDINPTRQYTIDAVNYGRMEPVTPWMGADSARHYQWYPFINLGHYKLAGSKDKRISREFAENMRSGIDRVARKGADNPFICGLPFIWCSNNLAVAFVTQAMLYRLTTGNEDYKEYETAARDWLMGNNPWGQTMIILPHDYNIPSPEDSHSAMSNLTVNGRHGRDYLIGGLVDGPVYKAIFNSLWGVRLRNDDKLAPYQGTVAVYHDDYSDYSTNEPTLDGTASLMYMLGILASQAKD